MKKIINLSFVLAGVFLASCEKTENKVYFEGGTPPNLTASTTTVRLEAGQENNQAIRFNWTNPEYRFNTGINSQNVSYTLEMDTVGGNFNSGAKVSLVIANELSVAYSVGDFNKILTTGLNGGKGMNLVNDPRRVYTIEARVSSSIGNAVKLLSPNKVTFTASPFPPPPKTATPVNDEIWLVGGASPGGWNNPLNAPFINNQKFTRRSRTQYDLVVNLNANDGYLILPVMGSWSAKYCIEDGVDRASTTGGGDFVFKGGGGQDFLSPTPGGTFKISLDFQLGKFQVVRQ